MLAVPGQISQRLSESSVIGNSFLQCGHELGSLLQQFADGLCLDHTGLYKAVFEWQHTMLVASRYVHEENRNDSLHRIQHARKPCCQ